MPRTKKVEEDIKESASEVETSVSVNSSKNIYVSFVPRTKISPLNADFGREDLNQIVGKLNEIINFINS